MNFGRQPCLCGNIGFHECQTDLQSGDRTKIAVLST